jgi:DnaK suppressor protein
MKKKDLEYFKKLLTEQLEDLLQHGENEVSRMRDPSDNLPDPTDRASFDADRSFMLRIRDREAKLINKIRAALERIEEGTFGICEICGEDISVKRLMARPMTNQCIACKTNEEKLEKAIGE